MVWWEEFYRHGAAALASRVFAADGSTLDLGARNANDDTLVLLAAFSGDLPLLGVLLAAGADVSKQNRNGQTGLHVAIRREHLGAALMLARHCTLSCRTLDAADRSGCIPLVALLCQPPGAMVEALCRELLAKGAAVDGPLPLIPGFTTPLHWGAFNGNEACVRLLLAAGAEMAAVDSSGESAVYKAVVRRHFDTAKVLLAAGAEIGTLLLQAAAHGDLERCELLLHHAVHVDLEQQNERGMTALHLAAGAEAGAAEQVAVLLLEHGADPNARSVDGCSSLICATRCSRQALVESLLERGADVHAAQLQANGQRGSNALQWASFSGNLALAQLLVAAGAQPGTCDGSGESALHKACHSGGSAELVAQLLDAGADINERSERSEGARTPLHWASLRGNDQAVRMLVTRGADVSQLDAGGASALHSCRSSLFTEQMFDAIVDASTDDKMVHLADNEGFTPLLHACRGRHAWAVSKLLRLGASTASVLPATQSNALHVVMTSHPWRVGEAFRAATVLIARDPQLVHQQNARGRTPIQQAAYSIRICPRAGGMQVRRHGDEAERAVELVLDGRTLQHWSEKAQLSGEWWRMSEHHLARSVHQLTEMVSVWLQDRDMAKRAYRVVAQLGENVAKQCMAAIDSQWRCCVDFGALFQLPQQLYDLIVAFL